MLHVYGPYMPVRTLEEIVFWKTQEREHTVVIRALTQLEPVYVQALEKWEGSFTETENTARQYLQAELTSTHQANPWIHSTIHQLICFSIEQSRQFIRFLEMMLQNSQAVKANPTVQVVIHHIMRESDYFLGILYSSEQ
ncbi:DUF2935 domain-containing protein [Aneurinibacillus tyrosinisolvens]|jgi:superoxide dismutase, Fe-Mn family|uniref:DUF2935 domain-containing protein n=1 Tax=Aneurinibacillus tyrosinisolvens TaxID=1443435 RepID=UPI00063F8381|nr:DUF2935 domain-containing protein [Aneurinibacillus tyrosinisolvens]